MNESAWNPCIIIPVYNHHKPLAVLLEALQQYAFPVIIIDDGSSKESALALVNLCADQPGLTLIRQPENLGKGAAVKTGIEHACHSGFTHGLQMDADGQHETKDIERFFDLAKRQPNAIICGCPVFDQSVPKARYYGRYVTHVWVWITSLSLEVKDSMCGFRVYPLASTLDLIHNFKTANRMEFDSEIMVRWVWQGYKIVNSFTPVRYPLGGTSHFLPWRDSYLLTRMFTRLFFGMLVRSPQLISRKVLRVKAP